jgi:hypothetical protein
MDVFDEVRVDTKDYRMSVLDNGTLEVTLGRGQCLLLCEIYSDLCEI